MTGISSYSTTASENVNANTGINWDEGMAPAAVNNSARQNMADIRLRWNDASWFQYGIGSKTVAAVYASATSFTLAGADATAYWTANRRVKAVGATTGTIYGSVSSSAFATSTTTVNVTWDSGSLSNESLTVYAGTVQVTGSPVPAAAIPAADLAARVMGQGPSSSAIASSGMTMARIVGTTRGTVGNGSNVTISGVANGLLVIHGFISNNEFMDLVFYFNFASPVVITTINFGSPPTRTYTDSAGSLNIALSAGGAAGTYSVGILALAA